MNNPELHYKILKYDTKRKNTGDINKINLYLDKIDYYNNKLRNDYYTKTSYGIDDNDGRIENDVYDIHAENKMYTHGIFTKIIDDENMLYGPDQNDILSLDGEQVAYDIRIDVNERKENGTKIYLPEAPDNINIINHYVPMPFHEEPQFLTTETGVLLYHNQDSLKVGERGPILMEDFHFRQKLRHFDHEQIPERVVHARGSGAYGTFRCTRSMTEYSIANFLQTEGKETAVFVRFSQVVGSKGSADTVRDARGFATKFYTDDGNFDIVGNNVPVFFIQDAVKFQDLVHSIKPEPDSQMPQATGAHDNFWDFISLTPESAHMVLWVISDIGVMRSYRTMEGAGVHSFKFVNSQGRVHYVKFHWKPHQGIETLSQKLSSKTSGRDIDYLRRDLWEAIKRGFYPRWDFVVQLMPIEDENNYPFDPLDPTKIWPEKLFPMIKCGELVLDRNPSNFFSEVEQSAFHVGNVVPGIDLSDDPLLQGRLFSYDDTQLNRFGSANFNEIPINQPIVKVRNNQRDGFNRMRINRGPVNYEPNTRANNQPMPGEVFDKVKEDFYKIGQNNNIIGGNQEKSNFWIHSKSIGCPFRYGNKNICILPARETGWKVRAKGPKFQDHFSQATARYLAMNYKQREHLINAFVFELGHVQNINIRRNMIIFLKHIHLELAEMIAERLVLE